MRGRRKSYATAEDLEAAVQAYFASISRLEKVKIPKETNKRDEYGHKIEKLVNVKGENGKPIMERVFYVPPEIFGLTTAIGISVDTWNRYGESDEFAYVVSWAEEIIDGWKSREALRRENKRTAGLIWEAERSRKLKQTNDATGKTSSMVALTDAQLIALASQIGEG